MSSKLQNEDLVEIAFFQQHLADLCVKLDQIEEALSLKITEDYTENELVNAFQRTLNVTKSRIVQISDLDRYVVKNSLGFEGININFAKTFKRFIQNPQIVLVSVNSLQPSGI
jgi:hypothetical protein